MFSFADFKSKMSLIVSVHVYSVQKALLKDSGPLYSVDYDAVKDNLKNCSRYVNSGCHPISVFPLFEFSVGSVTVRMIMIHVSCSLYRYSAIRCTSAVPMSPLELQQAQEVHRALILEPEPKKSLNGDANTASKPSTKPQKGIMGMFANKTAPKTQDNHRDMKSEQQDAPVVRFCIPGSDSLLLTKKNKTFSYWPVWSFQVDPPKSKPAKKVNPAVNFFGTQTASK